MEDRKHLVTTDILSLVEDPSRLKPEMVDDAIKEMTELLGRG